MSRLPAAVVLTAGLGTRLWPLTTRRAKPSVPLAGPTLIERLLAQLAGHGVADAVLNLHHRPETICECVGDGAMLGLRVRYSLEPAILGSAGGPRHALPLFDDDPFLIVNGDTLTDVSLAALVEAHTRSGAEVTLAVVPNPAPERYGGVLLDDEDAIVGFSRPGAVRESWHFVGLQVAARSIFAGIDDGTAIDSVGRVYAERLRKCPGSVRAFRGHWRFLDVGRPSEYLAAALVLANGEAARLVSAGARISGSAVVVDSIVWPGARVGDRARLTRCIVSDGVAIPAGTEARDAVIVPAAGLTPRQHDRVEHGLLICPI
jgi:NDP-sugar pyrophosphorylase family protein